MLKLADGFIIIEIFFLLLYRGFFIMFYFSQGLPIRASDLAVFAKWFHHLTISVEHMPDAVDS